MRWRHCPAGLSAGQWFFCACTATGRGYNRGYEEAGNIRGVLEFLRARPSTFGDAGFSHHRNAERLESAGRCDYLAKTVVGPGRYCGSVCICVVLTFFCGAQSPGDIRASVVVMAGRSKNGGNGAGRENESRSETLCPESEYCHDNLNFCFVRFATRTNSS
jgi:hypothetical protein